MVENKTARYHNVLWLTLPPLHYEKFKVLLRIVVFVNIYAKCISCASENYENEADVIYTRRGAVTNSRQPDIEKSPSYGDVRSFLTTFGYLPASDVETGNLRTEDELRDSIKNLQIFGNIKVTGEIDAATWGLMKRPRCGLPDISNGNFRNKRHALRGRQWHRTDLTWSLRTGFNGKVRRELSRALYLWAKHTSLSFKEVDDNKADILVEFLRGNHGDGHPFDGQGRILAHAFFPGSGRGGDAHFDREENWIVDGEDDEEGISLFAVAAHEFGHSLGLSHSSVPDALMYPWYHGIPDVYDLPNDDRLAIQYLYGSRGKTRATIPTYRPTVDRGLSPGHHPRHPFHPHNATTTTTTMPPREHHPWRGTTTTPTTATWPLRPITRPPRPTSRSRQQFNSAYQPPSPPPSRKPARTPDTCDTTYDAVAVIRGETFVFKDRHFWRIHDGELLAGYPALTQQMWSIPLSNATRINAAYERLDRKIVFFTGRYFYMFDANTLLDGYPKPLTAIGLPASLEKLDAAFIWGYDSKTYLFAGTVYWKFDEERERVELEYPQDMSRWRGVGSHIDAVFRWDDGHTYFFKGKGFWKFNDLRMRVENERPMSSAQFWMGCPGNPKNLPDGKPFSASHKNKSKMTSSSSNFAVPQLFVYLLFLFQYFYVYRV